MGKNSAPAAPAKPTSSVMMGDRQISNSYWNGNDYVTKFNPTAQEQQTFDQLNAALPQYYQDALDKDGAYAYAKKYEDKTIGDYNKVANENLTSLKDNLITGGTLGGSTGWNKIKAFNDSYNDTIANISMNTPQNAINYQNQLLGLAGNVSSAIGNYYNTGSGFASNAASMQQQGWGQNKDTFNMEMQAEQLKMAKQQATMNNIYGGINAAAGIGGALLGTGGLSSLGGMAKKTGGL